MEAGTTQRRGKGRETHATERTTASIAETSGGTRNQLGINGRARATERSGAKVLAIATAMIAVLILPGAADAQRVMTWVTNTPQLTGSTIPQKALATYDVAQGFRTGAHPRGWLVNQIVVNFESVDTSVVHPVGVRILETTPGGVPKHQSPVLEFERKYDINVDTNQNSTFELAWGQDQTNVLKPNTRYAVEIHGDSTEPSEAATLRLTNKNAETGEAGWSIDNHMFALEKRSLFTGSLGKNCVMG